MDDMVSFPRAQRSQDATLPDKEEKEVSALLPQYPVYVISKGRFKNCLTAKMLIRDGVDFFLVVEPQESYRYQLRFPKTKILQLPFSNLGQGSIPARNWCWDHAKKAGHKRHWILDDNIGHVMRRFRSTRIVCQSGPALRCVEDFTDRYTNVGIAGLAYKMFTPDSSKLPPFYLNVHVYSCLLILNSIPQRWRGRYNEDTDLCLQVLSAGLCTFLVNAFVIDKKPTMAMKGGNTTELYRKDGRLRMARSLERMWPGVVTTQRRFQRPQHVIKDSWQKFDTLPIPVKGLKRPTKPNEYGLELRQVAEIQSDELKQLFGDKLNGNTNRTS